MRYLWVFVLACHLSAPTAASGQVLFQESFENTSFASRGWYDSTGGVIDSSEHAPGTSTASLRCTFNQGGNGCNGGGPGRHLFAETDSVYVSYWVKYSSNYVGSGLSYHPHEFYILTNADDPYAGPAFNKLDVYIQQVVGSNGGVPQIEIQDGAMIDQARINVDLRGVTENRAVAGCNGVGNTGGTTVQGVFGGSDCYNNGLYYNAYMWNASSGLITRNVWHHVEAYIKLNTIAGGIGQNDGIIQYWLNGTLAINRTNAIMRTGANPNMKFNQLIIGPYIGNGSPVTQSMWVDDLTVARSRPSQPIPSPASPQNIRITR